MRRMAITKSAKKAHRASLKKRVFNVRRKRALTSSVKDARKAMSAETLAKAYQAIDKAAKRGIIKKNAAARKKSRLAKAVASGKK
jgi:small subunit ribosomal protein S20